MIGRDASTAIKMLLTVGLMVLQVYPSHADKLPGWKVETETSPIDDSLTVYLTLNANSPIQGWPGKAVVPTLILRCKEGKTDAYIHAGMNPAVESNDNTTVTLRFDKEKAYEDTFNKSTDGEALFMGSPEYMIGALMLQHKTMLFKFTPFNSSPTMTTFNLGGLDKVVEKLTKACKWNPEIYKSNHPHPHE